MNTITAAALAIVLLLVGCTDTSDGGTAASPQGRASTTSGTPSGSVSKVTDTCPDPHGGLCLGPLDAGSYETSLFRPHLDYALPDDTWANMEDLPGNFLLYRPQDPQDGVVGGSYLGVYQDVRAPDTDCAEKWETGAGHTPKDLVAFYQTVPGLQVSAPKEVSVGGLDGYELDFTVKRKDALCSFDGYPGTPLIIGNGVSDLYHVVLPQIEVRLVLLAWHDGNVTIEITNVTSQYTARRWRDLTQPILESFDFR